MFRTICLMCSYRTEEERERPVPESVVHDNVRAHQREFPHHHVMVQTTRPTEWKTIKEYLPQGPQTMEAVSPRR